MVHRLALFIGVVGAAGVIALSMFLGSLASTTDATVVASPSTEQPAARTAVKTVVDNVYVKPTPGQTTTPRNAGRQPAPAATRAPRAERERGDGGRERGDGQRETSRGGDD